MSKVTAVANPLLEPFKGIVFTSVHGDIGLAELCAGGGTLPYRFSEFVVY